LKIVTQNLFVTQNPGTVIGFLAATAALVFSQVSQGRSAGDALAFSRISQGRSSGEAPAFSRVSRGQFSTFQQRPDIARETAPLTYKMKQCLSSDRKQAGVTAAIQECGISFLLY